LIAGSVVIEQDVHFEKCRATDPLLGNDAAQRMVVRPSPATTVEAQGAL
jgi:hypothetical protein